MAGNGTTSDGYGLPYLVALDTATGLARRYARGAGGKAVDLDAAQFEDWENLRSNRQGMVMETIHNFRKYGSKIFE